MPRSSSCCEIESADRVARASAWLVAFTLVAGASQATVSRQVLRVAIDAGGRVIERTSLMVQIDERADISAWSTYAVYLDDHRELVSFEATIIDADGRRERLGKRHQDRVAAATEATFESAHYHVAELPGLLVGSSLEIDHTVSTVPYYPAAVVVLGGEDEIVELEVEIRGAGLRWRLDGPPEGVTVEEDQGGLRLRARDLEPIEPTPFAAGGTARVPVLRYAWGETASWEGVARWYAGLLRDLPRPTTALAEVSERLGATTGEPRDRLEILLAFLRSNVRYVAVEVGIGGYRPSLAGEVLERRWGDCKDKSLLLIELLRTNGIQAYPALIRLDEQQRIDREFPSPSQFNHLIVAVPEGEVAIRDQDPVAGGFLFLDPTQTHGGARWLHPGVQDQDALVVTDDGGQLVRTPIRAADESSHLAFVIAIDPEGNAVGRAGIRLTGQTATAVVDELENTPPERALEIGLRVFNHLLPAARLRGLQWEKIEGEVPAARFALAIELDHAIDFGAARPGFQLPSFAVTPDTGAIDALGSAAALRPQEGTTTWQIELPEGCEVAADDTSVENALGSFRQTISRGPKGSQILERRTRLLQRWVEPDQLHLVRELALAEQRASRRRVEVTCPER